MTCPGSAPRWRWRRLPPRSEAGLGAWLRKNLFATPVDSVLTVVALLFVAWALPQILDWAIFNAQWTGADRTACLTVDQGGALPAGWSGACWAFVWAKFPQFMFGRYPVDERWRVILTGIIFVALLAPLLIPRAPYKRLNAILFFAVFPFICFFLLVGGFFGLPLRGDLAVGRAAGDAGALLCRHRRLAAARHPAGARPPLEDAGRSSCSR